MTHAPLQMYPGIYKEASELAAEGRWTDGSNVRWWKGYPQRIGGNEKFINYALDSECRGVHAWTALDGTFLMAWGTQSKLWLYANGAIHDITPSALPAAGSGVTGYGWGEGGWGDSFWGGEGPTVIQAVGSRTWSLDNWGEDLIANDYGGAIYRWQYSGGLAGGGTYLGVHLMGQSIYGVADAAVQITNSPTTARGIFVSDTDRHLVAIGAHDGTADNPRNIRWCDQEDLTNWTASATTTAGEAAVSGGDIVGSTKTRLGQLIVSQTSCFLMTFIGGEYVFSIVPMGDNCGLVSPRAIVDYGGVAYWMGKSDFWKFDGALQKVDCDVHDYVFDNLNRSVYDKMHAGLVKDKSEIWFFYAAGDSEINRYAALNTAEGSWFIGPMVRTSWIQNDVISSYPIATDANGNILMQEKGDTEYDGSDISYFMETNEIRTLNGDSFTFVRKLVPDYRAIQGNHTCYIKVRKYPQTPQRTKGPYMFGGSTGDIPVRARGRSFIARIEGNDPFEMGLWGGDVVTHGKRG